MEMIEHRDYQTLLTITEKIMRLESNIHSNEWQTYRNVAYNPSFHHITVKFSLHFVDWQAGMMYSQLIESYWEEHKLG